MQVVRVVVIDMELGMLGVEFVRGGDAVMLPRGPGTLEGNSSGSKHLEYCTL